MDYSTSANRKSLYLSHAPPARRFAGNKRAHTGTWDPLVQPRLSEAPTKRRFYYQIHRSPLETAAQSALLDFLYVGISSSALWEYFSSSDCRFAEVAKYLAGARVLRQDTVAYLVQFLCSSNNNIGRITKMVGLYPVYLGNVRVLNFTSFHLWNNSPWFQKLSSEIQDLVTGLFFMGF